MDSLFERELMIGPSVTDAAGKLSWQGAFVLFMDAASEHAERLGIGTDLLRRGLFWLTVKTQVRFGARPRLGELVTLATWPERPERMRCSRSYQLLRGGEILVSGKTEWAVMDRTTGRLVSLAEVFPPELEMDRPSACPGPFARIADGFEDAAPAREYVVRATDIDLGGHMNNAAYVRAVMDSFTAEELSRMHLASVDVAFRAPCYEGDRLRIEKRRTETGFDVRVSAAEKTAVLARLTLG